MQKLLERRWVRLLADTGKGFSSDDCGQMAAALGYFSLLSVFPLLLLVASQLPNLLALFGVRFDPTGLVLALVGQQVSPEVAAWLAQGLEALEQNQGTAGLIGLATLLWGASNVFVQISTSFNRIWRVDDEEGRPSGFGALVKGLLRGRLLTFLLMGLVGVLMLLGSVLTAAILLVQRLFPQLPLASLLSGMASWAISVAVSVLALSLLYRFVPDTRVRWGDVWLGAVLAALVNELAKGLLARFIASGTTGAYQSIAGPLALMIWVYFTSQILFAGCELTRHYALLYGSRSSPSVRRAEDAELQRE
ncbi:MAG: YihY/virulence factor BrkB family protein [Chloroflexales bacterium]|nr:YihY/virulence factor BrkB family protein [Chloroflexales bacterium]